MNDKPLIIGRGEVSPLIARLVTPAMLALVLVAVFATVRLVSKGNQSDYLVLVCASMLSVPITLCYGLLAVVRRGQNIWASLLNLSAILPYSLSLYLFFYRGVWKLVTLHRAFSWPSLSSGIMFMVIGLIVVNGLYKTTELVAAVHEDRIKIT